MIPTTTAGGTTVALCVMCGAPASRIGSTTVALCDSPYCRSRHAALPPKQRCGVCSRPLAVSQWAGGHCGDAACREELLVRRPLENAAKALRALIASASKRRERAAAQRGIPREERSTYRMAVLPRNTDRPSALPAERRHAFEEHLRSSLAAARARLAAGEVPGPTLSESLPVLGDDRTDAERDAEHQLLGAGCATCRGRCCRQGGNHAFNDAFTMMRYLERFPTHDDETIVAKYLSYLAPRTLTHGCVFQHEKGCTLPRDLRADLCNRFYCGSISMIRNQFAAGEPVRAYFAHERSGKLVGGRFVEIPVVTE